MDEIAVYRSVGHYIGLSADTICHTVSASTSEYIFAIGVLFFFIWLYDFFHYSKLVFSFLSVCVENVVSISSEKGNCQRSVCQ